MSIYDKASLVLIPSGTKTSKVYSQKPVSGDGDFTFSRSTAATRVNASGNIEKETQNLLLQSNQFDTTWLNSNSSETSGQIGYDGTNNAWLITKTAAHGRIFQSISFSGVNTISFYAKANASDWVRVFIDGASIDAFFDLQNGIVGNTSGSGFIYANIESIANDWYRCSLTIGDNATRIRIYPAEANTSAGTSGSIYIQDAQLEQGLVARDYIETTTTAIYGGITDNVPRLDYTDSSCPALLLEPQRTNLLTQGEYFKSWSKTSASVTSNAVTSPEGVQNASKLVEASGSSFHFILSTPTIASGSVTFSFYAKSAERTSVSAFLTQSGNNGANFDLSAGTATAQGTGNTASIESVGDGWYRCVVTNSGSAQVASQVRIGVQNGALDSYVGDGTSGVYIYGAQVEQGSYATSYIPTYGSAVTRNAEDPRLSGADSLIGQNQGTLFLEYDGLDSVGGNVWFNVAGETSFQDWIFVGQSGTQARAYFKAGNTIINNWQQTQNSGINKIAMVYKPNSIKVFIDGELVDTHTGSWTFSQTMGKIELNAGGTSVTGQGAIRQSLLLPTALTDQEAIDLTTL